MTYDPADRVTQVAATNSYIGAIAYAPHGGFQSFTYGNLFDRFQAYNARLQPAEMVDVPASGGCTSSSPTWASRWRALR